MKNPISFALILGTLTGAALAGGGLYVDDDWAGTMMGEDPDGDGPAMMFGVDSFATIHDAYDAASPGQIVTVYPGIYQFATTLVVTKSISLEGPQAFVDPRPTTFIRPTGLPADPREYGDYLQSPEGIEDITSSIREQRRGGSTRTPGDPNTEAIIQGTGIAPFGGLISVRANNVSINGFEFRNAPGDMIESPEADLIDRLLIFCNIIHDSTEDECVQIRNSTNTTVTFNYVFNSFGDGINLCCGMTNGRILMNELHNDGPDTNGMIYVYDNDPMVARENFVTIQGNHLYNILNDDAIEVGAANGDDVNDSFVWVLDNVVEDARDDGIEVHMTNVFIARNIFRNCRGDGGAGSFNGAVSIEDGPGFVVVAANLFEDNDLSSDPTSGAVSVQGGTYVAMIGNTFRNNSPAAIWGSTPGAMVVYGNTFDGNDSIMTFFDGLIMQMFNNDFGSSNGIAVPLVHPNSSVFFSGNILRELPFFSVPAVRGESRGGSSTYSGNHYPGNFAITDDLDTGVPVLLSKFDDPEAIRDMFPMIQWDRDADGLSDGTEFMADLFLSLAYDPEQFDSIGAGVQDGVHSVAPYIGYISKFLPTPPYPGLALMDAITLDSDGDGVPDWYEYLNFSNPYDSSSIPGLGDVTDDGSVDIGDAIRALQIMNSTINPGDMLWDTANLDGINVTGTRVRNLNNALQILRFQNGTRNFLPANGILD